MDKFTSANQAGKPRPKKADIILKREREIMDKQDKLNQKTLELDAKLFNAYNEIDRIRLDVSLSARQSDEIYSALKSEFDGIRKEMNDIAERNREMMSSLVAAMNELSGKMGSGVVAEEGAVATSYTPAELDYDRLAANVAKYIDTDRGTDRRVYVADSGNVEIDYNALATKVAELMPMQEVVSPDLIAAKVAEQIIIPEFGGATATVDIDQDELVDKIALKVGALRSEDFDIIVDDEGCDAISRQILGRLDYDYISTAVADRIRDGLSYGNEPDYEEMAARISEKIEVPVINEDLVADKAAAALSNYIPVIDADEIADKVCEQMANVMPNAVDNDAIVNGVSEKLLESKEELLDAINDTMSGAESAIAVAIADKLISSENNKDYDIVIDEDGASRIATSVAERAEYQSGPRFDNVDKGINDIKKMLLAGVVVGTAAADATVAKEEPEDEEDEYLFSDFVTEESAFTTSSVLETEEEDEQEEEQAQPEQAKEELVVIGDQVEDSEDEPEVAEELDEGDAEEDEGVAGAKGGVDFLNMMKYNRSFISRVIQGSDEQKGYYGAVKNAFLSYKKVNSNIAWGAERFHKGRETIARFKIRGKTLVLYLALDPKDEENFPYSVYHQVDVSDNKSLHGTPFMVKVQSPRGVKKVLRLIDALLAARNGEKYKIVERDYAAMYPYETMEELIAEGLVKDVGKNN